MELYFIFLLSLKIFISQKFIQGNAFYFVFWRSSVIFYSLLFIFALVLNTLWTFHSFSYDVSNFLVPLLDFLYFLVTLTIFLFLLGKYKPSISSSYFYSIINFLLFFSLFYSFISLYFIINSEYVNLLNLFFPFGVLIQGIWIIGPLFGAFYFLKLNNNQKKILILSIIFLLLLVFISGRRSLLLFIIFFLIFYSWRTVFFKKILLIISIGLLYTQLHTLQLAFKTISTDKNANIHQLKEKTVQLDNIPFIKSAVIRIMHGYLLIEPVFKKLEKLEGVGFQPLKTAILAPIPSKFLDNKPWPGSLDGSKKTAFQYIVNKIAFNRGWEMSEYPISLSFIWQGSMLILVASIFATTFAMVVFFRSSIYFGDRFVILPLLTIYPGSYNYFLPEPIKLIQIFSYAFLPGFTVLFFLAFIKDLLKNINNKS
tara:strand:- start:16868 stop:18145 length:1278 start_codon:yes stop_codon:yes gene_type:complete